MERKWALIRILLFGYAWNLLLESQGSTQFQLLFGCTYYFGGGINYREGNSSSSPHGTEEAWELRHGPPAAVPPLLLPAASRLPTCRSPPFSPPPPSGEAPTPLHLARQLAVRHDVVGGKAKAQSATPAAGGAPAWHKDLRGCPSSPGRAQGAPHLTSPILPLPCSSDLDYSDGFDRDRAVGRCRGGGLGCRGALGERTDGARLGGEGGEGEDGGEVGGERGGWGGPCRCSLCFSSANRYAGVGGGREGPFPCLSEGTSSESRAGSLHARKRGMELLLSFQTTIQRAVQTAETGPDFQIPRF